MHYNEAMSSGSAADATRNCIFSIKAMMKGEYTLYDTTAASIGSPTGLWTCVGSSDSSSANMSGTDLWTASFDASKLVANAAGVHSWIVLRSPSGFGGVAGYLYFTIDMGVALQNCIFYLSKTLPTGGTTSACPTSPDSMTSTVQMTGGGTAIKAHGGITSEGSFFWANSANASGAFYTNIGVMSLLEAKSADTFPFLFWSGSSGTPSATPLSYTITGAASPSTNQTRDRSNTQTLNPSTPQWAFSSSHIFSLMTTTDSVDSLYDDLPMYVWVNRTGATTIKGRLPDIRWCPTGLGHGSYEPSAGTPVATVMGSCWVPTYVIPSL